jgi:hypothetical protein
MNADLWPQCLKGKTTTEKLKPIPVVGGALSVLPELINAQRDVEGSIDTIINGLSFLTSISSHCLVFHYFSSLGSLDKFFYVFHLRGGLKWDTSMTCNDHRQVTSVVLSLPFPFFICIHKPDEVATFLSTVYYIKYHITSQYAHFPLLWQAAALLNLQQSPSHVSR